MLSKIRKKDEKADEPFFTSPLGLYLVLQTKNYSMETYICPEASKGITICLTPNQGQLKLLYHIYNMQSATENKLFISMISCKLHIFCCNMKRPPRYCLFIS